MFITSFLDYCQAIYKGSHHHTKTSLTYVMKYHFSYPKLHNILSDFNYNTEHYKFIEKFVKESAAFKAYISSHDPNLG